MPRKAEEPGRRTRPHIDEAATIANMRRIRNRSSRGPDYYARPRDQHFNEAAYHRADNAIQQIIDLLAA